VLPVLHPADVDVAVDLGLVVVDQAVLDEQATFEHGDLGGRRPTWTHMR
jgi:hypothetical protein